jgi:hypothetical protein
MMVSIWWKTLTAKLVHAIAFCTILVGFLAGCDKDKDTTPPPKETPGVTVALSGGDLNADGTLTAAALSNLSGHSGDPILNVNFVHTKLSDAGLAQLAAFPNLRRVDASGSRVTPAGIDKLKKAIPEVTVNK